MREIAPAGMETRRGRTARTGPVESRWTVVDGLRMHHRVSADPAVPADRPPVVLVHGQVVSSRYMVPLAEHLAPDFHVYAPDLPGFGLSDKPPEVLDIAALAEALAAWMTQVGLGRAVLVGNSLGCQILAEFAVRHGDRVTALVLQGPTADPAARTAVRQIARWLWNGARERSPRMGWILLRDYLAAGPRRFILTFRHLLNHRIEDLLPRIAAPTLVLRGTRDPVVPPAWARRVADLLPDGRLIELPGATHTINFTAPLEFARVVRGFVGVAPATVGAGTAEVQQRSDDRGR